MKLFRNASIQRKQMIIIMLTTAVALLLACIGFATYEVITFRKAMLGNLVTLGDIVGDNSAAALDFNDPRAAAETLAALKKEPNIVGACIYLKNGDVFAIYDRSGEGKNFTPPKFQMSGHSFGKNDLILFDPIVYKGDTIGTVCLTSDTRALYSRLGQYAVIVSVVFLVALLVAFLISDRLQRLISEPILHLVETARAVAKDKNYSLRAVKTSQDELGALVDGFNLMLAKIQEHDEALQAAHQNLEQRVAERTKELASSVSLLNATLEASTDGILVVDRNNRIGIYNNKFVEMWGLPREKMVSGQNDQVLPLAAAQMKDPDGFLAKIRELYQKPDAESHDILELKDGRTFERDSQPQRLNGECIGRVWSFSDVTERRCSEAELAKTSSLMEALLANSLDCIYFKDLQSRFVRFSSSMAPKLGATDPSVLIGKTDFDFFSDEHARPAFEDEQEIIRTGQPMISKAEKETHTDGRISWALTTKLPWHDKEGNIIGTFGISKDITAIKDAEAKLEQAHKDLVDTSRQAGMAEVATSVLHNVGNVLNSVNISCSLVAEKVRKSRVVNLAKAVALMQAHKDNLPAYFGQDAKGKQLPDYLSNLAVHLAGEQEEIMKELALLTGNIEHIKEIVTMQQSYARVSGVLESLSVADLIEDALRMNAGALDRHQVRVIREIDPAIPVIVEKHKVLQILVNLIRNAKYALDDGMPPEKRMTLRAAANGDDMVRISVIDNGVGIPVENLTRIFGHGFTTRKEGHGFGLHSGALAARELGGCLTVHSDGPGKGACFMLEFPREPRKKANI